MGNVADADARRFEPAVAREWWGAGGVFGAYPAPGQVMCAAGGPAEAVHGDDVRSMLHHHLASLIDHNPVVGAAIDDMGEAYSWAMRDVRADRWIDGRIALCGDAAVGFMPTAGAGASYAMRAAAGLADELSRADAATVPLALELYQKRCRGVIERGQTDSRRLARVMFVRHQQLAWAATNCRAGIRQNGHSARSSAARISTSDSRRGRQGSGGSSQSRPLER